jgi:hypothetical protein
MAVISFEHWVDCLFGRPGEYPPSFASVDVEYPALAPETALEYVTRLFSDAGSILARFDDAQVNQGLWELVGASGELYPMLLTDLPWPDRKRGILSMAALYESLFLDRCSAHLSHRDDSDASPLNSICYMWWDVFPTWGQPGEAIHADRDAALLEVMGRALELDSEACRESGLHGLGHWHMHYPTQTSKIIQRFLDRETNLGPALLAYARSAGAGCVQ